MDEKQCWHSDIEVATRTLSDGRNTPGAGVRLACAKCRTTTRYNQYRERRPEECPHCGFDGTPEPEEGEDG